MSIRAWVQDGRLQVESPVALRERAQTLPGARWNKWLRTWHLPSSPAAAGAVIEEFTDQTVLMDSTARELLARYHARQQALSIKEATDLPDIPGNMPAWLHQRRAFHFAKDLDGSGLFMDMGTGKSRTAISLLEYWNTKLVLVLGPRNVIRVWPKQLGLHGVTEWLPLRAPERSTVAKRTSYLYQQVELAIKRGVPGIVVLVNYEAAWRPPMDTFLLGTTWDAVIADESHKLAAPGGRASRFIARLNQVAKLRPLLSGTPFRAGPHSIYGQYRFAEPGIFGTNYAKFRARYCVMGGYENHQVVGYNNEPELTKKIGSISFFVKKAEAGLDLPPVLDVEREFELGAKEERTYRQAWKEWVVDLDDELLAIQHGGVRILRLQQATGGHLPDDAGGVHRVGTSKTDELQIALEELDDREPVVVFCKFVPHLDRVREVAAKLGRRYKELSGRRHDGLTQDATMDPDTDVLGVQVQAGGLGIDLTRAAYGIFFSTGYDLVDYEQCRSRQDRPGQTRPVTFIHLISTMIGGRKTVDRDVYTALTNKQNVVEYFVEQSRKEQ